MRSLKRLVFYINLYLFKNCTCNLCLYKYCICACNFSKFYEYCNNQALSNTMTMLVNKGNGGITMCPTTI